MLLYYNLYKTDNPFSIMLFNSFTAPLLSHTIMSLYLIIFPFSGNRTCFGNHGSYYFKLKYLDYIDLKIKIFSYTGCSG